MYAQTLKRLVVASLMISIALYAVPAVADVAQGLRYDVPKGWMAGDRNGARILAPSDLKTGEVMMAIVFGVAASTASPEDQLAQFATSINTDAKVSSASDVAISDLGSAGKLYIKKYSVASQDLGAHDRMVVILARGEQRAVILFVITNTKVLQKYGAGMQALLKSFAFDAAPASIPPTAPTAPPTVADGHLPTGETPNAYPGSPGWLPSGRGVAIPVARVVNGKPEGLWWHFESSGPKGDQMAAITTIFLADGTRATNPRPGSGTVVDLDGQRKGRGTTGVGTFAINDGKITQSHDGFTETGTFRVGSDNNGPWIEIGGTRHFPLAMVTAKELVGNWKGVGGQTFMFRADGTFASGGGWQLDGYLLSIRNGNRAPYITTVGWGGKLLVLGTLTYTRE